MTRSLARRLATVILCSLGSILLLAPARAQTRKGAVNSDFGVPLSCTVNGPDRICGQSGPVNYSASVIPAGPNYTYAWTLHSTTTNGCLGTGTASPSFCGPTNQPTVCVVPGLSGGRFVLRVAVTDGHWETVCCLSVNVTVSTSTTAPAPASICEGLTHTFCTTASGTGPFTYTWAKNGTAIPGATGSCYTATAGSAGTTDNFCVTTLGSGTCGVPYTACTSLSSLASTTVASLPAIRRCSGGTYLFCATAGGTGPFTYAWTLNGTTIPGETGACVLATAGAPGTVGSYCVTVAGPCGPPVTRCGTLTVNANAAASSLTSSAMCEGMTYTFCTTAGGTGPFSYSWTRNGTAIPGATGSCYTATTGPAGTVDSYCVDVGGACGSAQSCATLGSTANTSTATIAAATVCEGVPQVFCVSTAGTPPFSFSWTKNGVPIGGQTSSCILATAGAAGTVDTYCATVSGTCGPPSTSCFELTAVASTTIVGLQPASGCPGSSQTLCVSAGGTGPFSYAWSRNGASIAGATNSCIAATAGASGTIDTYCVDVSGTCGTGQACTTVTAFAETTASALSPATGCEGATQNFCTTAGGTGPFTYVWSKNGVPIPGATSNCYTATVGASDDSYCVDVTGICGTAQRCTTLTVNPPTAATNLSDASGCAGEPVTLCTTASGTGPFGYQWTRNGSVVPGQTGSCYAFDLAPGDTQVCVTVTGACGPVVRCAVLSVQACGGSHCTLTQGGYGNEIGQFNQMDRLALITQLLQSDMAVGVVGTRSLTFQAGVHDAQCVIDRLPTSGTAATLPAFGDELLESDCQTSPTQIPLQSGRFENILLGQVISLSLNIRLASGVASPNGCTTNSTGLSAQTICETMISQDLLAGPDGCSGTSDDVPAGPNVTVTIGDSVMDSLAALFLPQTVGGVLELGNRALAGMSTGTADLSEISAAVDSINILFDECREIVSCTTPP